MKFNYCYQAVGEMSAFFRMPKALFTEPIFKKVSPEAKLLYGMMLDRVNLSAMNGWVDDSGRIYIYFTMNEVQEVFGCGHDKALKLLAELDTEKGVGLIERIKRSYGRASIIYVRYFPEMLLSQESVGQDLKKIYVIDSEKSKLRPKESESLRLENSELNKT